MFLTLFSNTVKAMNARFTLSITLALLALVGLQAFAQSSGRAHYRVYWSPNEPDSHYSATLDFSQSTSIYTGADYTGKTRSGITRSEYVDEKGNRFINQSLKMYAGEVYVVSEIQKHQMQTFQVLNRGNGGTLSEYVVEEPLGEISWEFVDTTSAFSGIRVQGAKGWFRGREYFAWYAPLIPVGFGPWKFNGLPGLILDVHEIDGVFAFRFDGIELDDKHAMPEVIFPKTAEKISIKDYAFYRGRMGEDMANLIRARSARRAEVNFHTVRTGDEALIEKNFADIFGTQE